MNLILKNSKNLQQLLLCLLPLALVTGPFLPDLFAILIAFIFIINSLIEKKWHYYHHPLAVIFWIWCSFLILRSLASDNPLLSFESSLFYWRFGIFALAVWYIIDNNPKIIKLFTWSLTSVFIIVLLDGYLQFFSGKNILGFPSIGTRISGFFGEELILGSFLSRLLPIMFALMIVTFGKSKKMMTLAMIVIVLTDLLIYISGERAAFFYLILSTFTIIVFVQHWKLLRLGAFAISIILLVIISISYETFKERMIDQTLQQTNITGSNDIQIEEERSSYGGGNSNIKVERQIMVGDKIILGPKVRIFSIQHQVIFISAYKIFLDNIIIGVGPKMFREICKKSQYIVKSIEDRSIDGCQTHPHNTYVQLLSETGLLGALPVILGFVLICFVFIRQGFSFIQSRKLLYSDYQICLYTAILITLWPFVPTGNLFNNWLSVIYFLPIGFLLNSYKK